MNFINKSSYTRIEDLKRLQFIQSSILNLKNPKAKVLDVGCGNGNISYQIASLGFEVLGIDISKKAIETAKKTNKYSNLSFSNLPIESLSINKKFDVIICSEVIEHLQNPEAVIKNLIHLLNKNSILIITVPNGYGPREVFMTKPLQAAMKHKFLWNIVLKVKCFLGYKGGTVQSEAEDLTHIQFFTKKSLFQLLENQNLSLQKFKVTNFIEGVFPFSFLANRIKALQKFDNWIANYLPDCFSSGFMTTWRFKQ